MARRKKAKKMKAAKLETTTPETGYRKPETHVCPPCSCAWEGGLMTLIGALGIIDYFGLVDLSVIKWSILWPVILVVVGLLMISGLGKAKT